MQIDVTPVRSQGSYAYFASSYQNLNHFVPHLGDQLLYQIVLKCYKNERSQSVRVTALEYTILKRDVHT